MIWPQEGSREVDEGIIVSEAMDWCNSPTEPVPYRIWARQIQASRLADSVRQTNDRSHVKDSIVLTSYGDEPGVGGGVTSGSTGAECTPKTWSETVLAEGRNMVRHDDEWWMNNRNTWGKLIYKKDQNIYPDHDPKICEAMMASMSSVSGPSNGNGLTLAMGRLVPGMRFAPDGPGGDVLPRIGPRVRPVPRVPPRFSPKPGPEPGPEPNPPPNPKPRPPGLRTTGCRSELICFNNTKYDETEYRKQLKMQQDGLNSKTACKNEEDIDRFDGFTQKEKDSQRGRADYERDTYFLPKWMAAHGNNSPPIGTDALHEIDMVVGGYEKNFFDYGDGGVNQSIGSSWTADSRKGKLKRYVTEMCPNCRMSVTLDICESNYDPNIA